jgi:hypothetical protein
MIPDLPGCLQVTGLLQSQGQVRGVTYKTQEGQQEQLEGDAVVLATGGFGANKELLKKYAPQVPPAHECIQVHTRHAYKCIRKVHAMAYKWYTCMHANAQLPLYPACQGTDLSSSTAREHWMCSGGMCSRGGVLCLASL